MGVIISQPVKGPDIRKQTHNKCAGLPVASVRAVSVVKFWATEEADDDCAAEPDVVHKAILPPRVGQVE